MLLKCGAGEGSWESPELQGEGNGNPLQCSCLENPRDGGAWWAAVYGVTQSQTWLKWLSSSSSKPANPKGNLPWILIRRTDAEAKAPILWSCEVKSRLIGKAPNAGKDWWREKGTTEDKMVGRHQWLWTWVWANSWRWWRTGRPGMLQSTALQRVRHNLENEQQQKEGPVKEQDHRGGPLPSSSLFGHPYPKTQLCF